MRCVLAPRLEPATTQMSRVEALVEAGVDMVIIVDTAHGFSKGVIERVKQRSSDAYPDMQVIAR